MTPEEIIDRIGELADSADNLLAAGSIPIPEHIAKPARQSALKKLRDDLRTLYTAGSGENPWSTHP